MKKKVQFLTGAVFTAMLFAAVLSCGGGAGGETTYDIGDTGPGGGKIFYVNAAGFAVSGKGTCKYLEAAPADISGTFAWASGSFTSTELSCTSMDIGTGYANTQAILKKDPNAPAADACDKYTNGGKDDWFLPSADELTALRGKKAAIGGFAVLHYWSSSEVDAGGAWAPDFSDPPLSNLWAKTDNNKVRPIRAF
ncbi:hypothetical protein AGMMS50230_23100 [Spirochaetia bacterium]|nr:hypothetical protein AGMMS50230_23100 [Spirochaetia bacterium]